MVTSNLEASVKQAHNQVQIVEILGGGIDSLGGAGVWVVAPTCYILRMSTAEP